MRRLTQYDGSGKAESYIGEFDEINIYRGGMEGDYISGYQITRLAQYEDLGTVEELKEISEIKNQVIDQNSLDKSLKEIRSLDKDILLERCENQQIELYQLYKMLGYAKQIASRPADIVWGEMLMDHLDKYRELKNNQSKIALEKLYAIENMLIDMHTNEESFEDISESVSIMVSDMISKLEGGE